MQYPFLENIGWSIVRPCKKILEFYNLVFDNCFVNFGGGITPILLFYFIFYQGEAVRMIRSCSNIIQRDDVLEKLRKWRDIQQKIKCQDNVLWEKETCIHNKPMLTQLYCLDSLPQSQSQK